MMQMRFLPSQRLLMGRRNEDRLALLLSFPRMHCYGKVRTLARVGDISPALSHLCSWSFQEPGLWCCSASRGHAQTPPMPLAQAKVFRPHGSSAVGCHHAQYLVAIPWLFFPTKHLLCLVYRGNIERACGEQGLQLHSNSKGLQQVHLTAPHFYVHQPESFFKHNCIYNC